MTIPKGGVIGGIFPFPALELFRRPEFASVFAYHPAEVLNLNLTTKGQAEAASGEMILRQVFVLAAVGLAIGLPTGLGATKLVESFLFGMRHNDPLALTLAGAILLGAALLAGYVPARKAARIDPMTALRHE
jgi:hypothetical protein